MYYKLSIYLSINVDIVINSVVVRVGVVVCVVSRHESPQASARRAANRDEWRRSTGMTGEDSRNI